MNPCPWRQVNIVFPDWDSAEHTAVACIAPLLNTAEAEQRVTAWFFIRKAPCWRVRYLPDGNPHDAQTWLHHYLGDLKSARRIADLKDAVYEPETRAFGGAAGMACAHDLFHLDARHLLTHLADTQHLPTDGHRRELSVMLCSALLRAAGLDWYEQGDVWSRVAAHRVLPAQVPPETRRARETALRKLITADASRLTQEIAPPGFVSEWARAFTTAGRQLAELAADGRLRRGLRAILAHQVIFTWNRHGLPHTTQAVIAHTATTVVFGDDPAPEEYVQQKDKS